MEGSHPLTFFEDGIVRAHTLEPTKAMNIECLMVLDRSIDRSAFRSVLLERGLCYHRMRSRIKADSSKWGRHFFVELDPEAIVDKMLHETRLTDGTWQDLQALLSRELLKPWRQDLPHWEVHVIHGLRCSPELPGFPRIKKIYTMMKIFIEKNVHSAQHVSLAKKACEIGLFLRERPTYI